MTHATKTLLRRMSEADEKRFGRFVRHFVEGCGIDPPFHLVAIGANGSVEVSLVSNQEIKQVCASPIIEGLTAPIIVAVIAPDGRGSSARIEVEAMRPTMQ